MQGLMLRCPTACRWITVLPSLWSICWGAGELPGIAGVRQRRGSATAGFQRTRLLGEAIGRFARGLNKRVLILGSGGLSHQPPVPQLASADAHMRDRLLGSGRKLPPDERQLRQHRVISAARAFVEDQNSLHPLNPVWDNQFMDILSSGQLAELDALGNDELSAIADSSAHEVKS